MSRVNYLGLLPVLGMLAVGCEATGGSDSRNLQKQVEAQKQHITRLEEETIALKKAVDEQKEQIATLQNISGDRLSKLIVPEKIELDTLTGGYDDDKAAGDDGVVAYVRPIDADGHIIKAAGSLELDVFDLAAPAEQSLVGHAELDVDHTRKAWHGRLWTSHFTIKCPWKPPARKPPEHRDLTVRVRFTDYITGKTFMTQTTCQIKLPADAVTTRP